MLKKKEISILLIIIICFGGLLITRSLIQKNTVSDKKLVVTSHDTVVLEAPLTEDLTKKITTEEGYNLIIISDGKASVQEADCANQVCVRSTAISEVGETIACLPHRLLLEIKRGN